MVWRGGDVVWVRELEFLDAKNRGVEGHRAKL
jgi:hypothetical protein